MVAHVRYRIVDSLGRGGMGEVCLADDLVLHRPVALKFLTASEGSESSDQLLTEARAAAALDHPFICAIYEVTSIDDRPCIAMEFVRGETLERRLRRGPLPIAEGLRVAEEMAEALEAAHNRRIIHRDLKPANVMFREDQHIKVMDFGLAARLPAADEFHHDVIGTGTTSHSVSGTPAYMAPEQIRGEPLDRRSDIFSFGVLLYELLSGSHPFLRVGVDATFAAILHDTAAPLRSRVSGIPRGVSDVVDRMLAKDPAERYQSFGEIRRELRRLTVDIAAPVPAPPVTTFDSAASQRASGLVGRESERAQLLDSLKRAASGQGGVVVLTGEPGVGKTRLAEDVRDAARRLGWQTLVGRCYEEDGKPPLIPYIEILEAASQLMPPPVFRAAIKPGAPELARILPELHRLFPEMPAPLELPPALRLRFLFTNIQEFLARSCRFAPLLVSIDDVQWADETTVQLTQHLAPVLASLPIVVVLSYRDMDASSSASRGTLQAFLDRARGRTRSAAPPASVKHVIDQLTTRGQARAIALKPFGEVDVRRLLTVLGDSVPPARMVHGFLQQTGGNPFFITELFRHLNDERRLFDERRRWKRDVDFAGVDVPGSVRAVLERRLQKVSSDTLRVLRTAAVIGPRFELDLLEAVAGVDEDTLIGALEEAEAARLLKGPAGRQETSWRFTHHLVCQALMFELPSLRRQRMHLKIADAMTAMAGSSSVYMSEIAHHLYSAGRLAQGERTAKALIAAGDAAHAMYATEEAVQHYDRALEVLQDSGDAAARRATQEVLADLLGLLGEYTAAMEHYQTLSSARDAATTIVDEARVSRKMGTLHWQAGDRSGAMTCYQRALRACDGSAAHLETARLYQELGWAAFRSGDNRQAIEWCERSQESAKRALMETPSPTAVQRKEALATLAHANNTIGIAHARSGDLDAARERIEACVTAAKELGLLDVACRGYANLGVLYSTIEPRRAIDVSLVGLEIASRIGAASLQSYIYANLAAAYCSLTERCDTEGLEAAQASAELDRRIGQLDHLAVPLIVMAQIHQCRGELPSAQRYYEEALALAEQAAEPQLILPCYDGLATIYLDRGDRDRAAQFMERAKELCERTGTDPDSLLLLPFLS
jgi:adenylate cyclase